MQFLRRSGLTPKPSTWTPPIRFITIIRSHLPHFSAFFLCFTSKFPLILNMHDNLHFCKCQWTFLGGKTSIKWLLSRIKGSSLRGFSLLYATLNRLRSLLLGWNVSCSWILVRSLHVIVLSFAQTCLRRGLLLLLCLWLFSSSLKQSPTVFYSIFLAWSILFFQKIYCHGIQLNGGFMMTQCIFLAASILVG